MKFSDFEVRDSEEDENWAWAREQVARITLEYWKEYRQPIGGLLRTFALDLLREKSTKVGREQREELISLVERLKKPELSVASDAMTEKIIRYKQRQKIRNTILKMIGLQEENKLTPEEFRRLSLAATNGFDTNSQAVDYRETLEARIQRRETERSRRFPYLYIEPLDEKVRTIPRGQVGLIIAKYKIGKSAFFAHMAQAFALQGYKVVMFTLEDSREMVEDRLDASLCGITLQNLPSFTTTLRERFEEQMELISGGIQVVDATGGGWSVQRMIEMTETLRNRGFEPDAVLIDYDEQVEPPHRYKSSDALRLHSHEIYIELTRWAARDQLYLWTAAQATIPNLDKMIIGGEDSAEDKSKIRKVGMAIGIGMGPPSLGDRENTRYLYVAAHRFGRQRIGWPIVGQFNKAIFYDPEKTKEALKRWRGMNPRERLEGAK